MTVDLAKTIFHSARLMVVFEPIQPLGTVPPASRVTTLNDAINCHKDIIDIRKGNTFTLKFPFTATTPYLATERPFGYMHIFVLNALVTETSTVPAEIDVGLKFFALDDMEFAAPSRPRKWPYTPADLSGAGGPETDNTLLYESGLEVGDSQIVDKMIGGSSAPTSTTEYSEMCIGEKVLSMKQIAMRSKMVKPFGLFTGKKPMVDPFTVDQFLDTTLGTRDFLQFHDFYSYVGSCYAYARGGVILTIKSNNASEQIVCVCTDPVTSTVSDFGKLWQEFHLQHIIHGNTTDRLYIPQYSQSYVRFTQSTLTNYQFVGQQSDVGSNSGLGQVRFVIIDGDNGQVTNTNTIYRAGADDTQFGGFAGIPYMAPVQPFEAIGLDDFKLNYFKFPNS